MLKILIGEADPAIQQQITTHLKNSGMELTSRFAERYPTLKQLIQTFYPDVILVSYSLPQLDIPDVLKVSKETCTDIPLLLLAHPNEEEQAAEAINKGIHDYILNNHMVRLIPAIQRELKEAEMRRAHQRTTQLLQEQERNLGKAQKLAQLGSCELNIATGECRWSDQLYRLLGLSPQSFLPSDKTLLHYIHPDDQAQMKTQQEKAVHQNKNTNFIIRCIDIEGQVKHLHTSFEKYAPLNQDKLVCSFLDITAYQQVKEDLQKAKEEAEKADRLKTEFLSNMSHEIRTPMNGILGFTRLLLRQADLTAAKQDHYLNVIHQSGQHLLSIINNIIEISKIEAGETTLKPAPFDLHQLLDDIYAFFKEKPPYEKHQILLRSKKGNPATLILNQDHARLKQVLLNIINNAYKFTDQGTITFGYQWHDASTLLFYVSDTGQGIPSASQSSIFDRFHQATDHSDPSPKHEGAGLGLSICKAIVEKWNGRIWFESKENQGTTFYWTLPAALSTQADTTTIPPQQEESTIPDLHHKTVLIAEDEPLSYELFKEIIDGTGIQILHAENGREALDLIEKYPVDLVFMDIKMPVMDGIEATQTAKALHPDLPVIALTANAMDTHQEKCRAAGCDEVITKPFDHNQLYKQLTGILDQRTK